MTKVVFGVLTAAAMAMAAPAFAATTITPGGGEGSSTDAFNQAVTITGNSDILPGFSVDDAFGAVTSNPTYPESAAGGHVIFNNGGANFINFNTAAPVLLSGINVLVASDGPSTDRSFDTVSIYGGTAPGALSLLGTANLRGLLGAQTVSFTFDNAAYQYFGFTGESSSNGPRVIEIDAVAAVPELGTWAMMLAGFGMLGGALRRRRTTVAFAA